MNKHFAILSASVAALSLCAVVSTSAQGGGNAPSYPQLSFHLVEDFFQFPPYSVIGRVTGVSIGPNGNIVTLNRGYHPVIEFASDGSFVRSWGEGSGMFLGAHQIRFDPQGNLWYVAAADNVVYGFNPKGHTIGIFGTNPEPWTWLTHVYERGVPGRSALYQPTDIGWSSDGSAFVADGYGNSRVAKFGKDGLFVTSWGERGRQPGNFNTPHGLVVDDNDVIYVADRANSRVQTFDTEGNLKDVWDLPTAPWSLCVTDGPNQVLFVGSVGRVYKMDRTGKVLGVLGRSGRTPGTLDSIHALACPDENTLYLANLYAGRFDKWVAN